MAPFNSGFILEDDPATPRTEATVSFRDIIPRPDHPRIAGIDQHSARSWCDSRRAVEAPAWLINRLDVKNIERPYKGFSADGHPDPSIFHYDEDEGAPVEAAAEAVNRLLDSDALSPELRQEVVKGDVETDDEFRAWSNPELYVNEGASVCLHISNGLGRSRLGSLGAGGIRLDETTEEVQELVHGVLKASLSPAGYEKALGCTLTNHFLGELVNGLTVLNKHSYNFRLFLLSSSRRPSLDAPWGFTFFGHHLCLAVVFVGRRMVIGPTFMGAEPDRIDTGPHAGLRLFSQEEIRGLNLMRGLSEENQKKAQLNVGMTTADGLAEDRWNPFDERCVRLLPAFRAIPLTPLPPSRQPSRWSAPGQPRRAL